MAQTEDQEPITDRIRRLEMLSQLLVRIIFDGDDKAQAYLFDLLHEFPIDSRDFDSQRKIERLIDSVLRGGRGYGYPIPTGRRLQRIENRVEDLADEIGNTNKRVGEHNQAVMKEIRGLADRTQSVQIEAHSLLAIQALGLPTESVKLTRFVPVRIYIDETPDGAVEEITTAVKELLNAYDFEVADEFPAIKGSWFQKFFAKSKDVLTQPEVVKRLEKIERAVEISKIIKPQAEADEKHAKAMTNLVKALDKYRNGAMQAGSVLVVKTTPPKGSAVIMARTLSQAEMIALENNQMLLQNPTELLSKLAEACAAAKIVPQNYITPGSVGGYVSPSLPSSTSLGLITKSDS